MTTSTTMTIRLDPQLKAKLGRLADGTRRSRSFLAAEAVELARFLDGYFSALGQKVHVVVNYDHFQVGPGAEQAYWDMVRSNREKYFLSSVRYSTQAFTRRRLAAGLASAGTGLFDSFAEAMKQKKE